MKKHLILMFALLWGSAAYGYTQIVLTGKPGIDFEVTTDNPKCNFKAVMSQGPKALNASAIDVSSAQVVVIPATDECKKACVQTIKSGSGAYFEQYGSACSEAYFAAGERKGDGSFSTLKATTKAEFDQKMSDPYYAIIIK